MIIKRKNVLAIILVLALTITSVAIAPSSTYAAQKSKKVKATFNVNGGKFTTKKYSKKAKMVKSITKGKKVGKLPKAKRTGYALKGWYTKKSGGKKVSKNTKIKKKTTYYAQWVAKDYKITFDPNGGTAPTVKTKKVKYKGRYGTLPTTKRNGYNFKGWYTARSGGTKVASTSTNTVAANDTLYAQWSGEPINDSETYKLTVSGSLATSGLFGEFTIIGSGNYKPGTKVLINVIPLNFDPSFLKFKWSAYRFDPMQELTSNELGPEYITDFAPGDGTGVYIIMPDYDIAVGGSFYGS